jgi:tetratricopeptide (TPR) repeat protein
LKGVIEMLPLPAAITYIVQRNRILWTGFLLLATCATTLAQGGGIDTSGTGGRHSINGRVVFPSGQRADVRLKVRLESSGFGDISILSDSNGSFSFQALRPGNYTVVIDGGDFYETYRESVFIEPATISSRRTSAIIPISRPFTLQIYLRPKASATNKPGVVSAALAKVPKAAAELYLQALDSSAKEDRQKAVAQLQQALAIHPGFPLALNELGVQYLKLGHLEKAVETLRSAVSLAPTDHLPRLNYGIALLNQRRFSESETQFREAVKLNPTAVTAHMYLGIALVNLKNYPEAEVFLEKAVSFGGTRVSQAHYYLGGLYWRAGKFRLAADELEKYLVLEPKATNAEKIRATIKDLRIKS